MGETVLGGTLLITLAGMVLLVCWVLLPFAMFGLKPLLREVRDQQKRTNALLEALVKQGTERRLP